MGKARCTQTGGKDDPDLYLDEIQEELDEWWFLELFLHMKSCLSQDCNYSLQVASDRSYAADKEERSEFLQALADRVINPNQLIFLDESQKDRNSSRRRRCWSKKDKVHSEKHTWLVATDDAFFLLAD